jgi:hypothetical protein
MAIMAAKAGIPLRAAQRRVTTGDLGHCAFSAAAAA